MPASTALQLQPAIPEIVLAVLGMALLMIGVFKGNQATRQVSWLVVASLLGTAFLVVNGSQGVRVLAMGGLFVSDGVAVYAKLFILIGSAIAVLTFGGSGVGPAVMRYCLMNGFGVISLRLPGGGRVVARPDGSERGCGTSRRSGAV